MNADGVVDDREMAVLHHHVENHDLFAGVSPTAAKTMIDLAADAVRFAGDPLARIPAIARGLPSRLHRFTAYSMALEIVAADDDIAPSELAFLDTLRLQLRITPAEAEEVMAAQREGRLAGHVDSRVTYVRRLMPTAALLFAHRANLLGVLGEEHRNQLREFFLAIPDLALSVPEVDAALIAAFAKPRTRTVGVIAADLAALAQAVPDRVDRWWLTVYAMVIEPPRSVETWRQLPFLNMVQQAFGLADNYLDLAFAEAAIFPVGLPRPG